MKTSPKTPALVFALVSVFYAVGLVGHALPLTLPWMLALTPWFLLGAGVLVLVPFAWQSDLRTLTAWFVPVLLLTFGLEVLGVATGAVFGPYHYSEVLGSLWAGVPPVIGWNWALVVLGVATALRSGLPRVPAWGRVVAVGVLCVVFDLLLEPVAIALGYWVWHGGDVPLQNYLAWGLIAAAGAWWAERFPRLPTSPLLGWYALLQALFFLSLTLLGVRA